MYSGTYGCMMKVDIYMGVVYYQRLRHMVFSKSKIKSFNYIFCLFLKVSDKA